MLEQIRLQNFRGFKDHTITLRPMTLAVGKNNAGKSSFVEALRLLSLVTTRLRGLAFREAPSWGGIPRREVGVRPSLVGTDINFDTLFHRYGDGPAQIEARFSAGASLKIYVGTKEEGAHAVLFNKANGLVRSKAAALALGLPVVQILPQIGPLDPQEVMLSPEHVSRNASSALSSRHFRNQLVVLGEHVTSFKAMVEETWPGLRVMEIDKGRGYPGDRLAVRVRDDDFAAEVSAMGHGLQMWLQTIWFLARSTTAACVILDEPDVYMHPDLQRRLVRYLRRSSRQVIIATHSVEMMAEVDPENVLVVDRRRQRSSFAAGTPEVQRLVQHVGSVHNLQLARLWTSRRCLIVEGKDVKALALCHQTLFGDRESLEAVPHFPMGGWGGWNYAIGSSLLLRNAGGEAISVYCIFDSDYHSSEAIAARYDDARARGVQLHVWTRKELENYFLVPSAIIRAIDRHKPARASLPTEAEVLQQLQECCDDLRDEVFDAFAAEVLAEDRRLGAGGANKKARERMAERWTTPEARSFTASGKQILGRMSAWAHVNYGVSLSAVTIAREMVASEIPPELRDVLSSIENGKPFPSRAGWSR
jgi:hypothetical protein